MTKGQKDLTAKLREQGYDFKKTYAYVCRPCLRGQHVACYKERANTATCTCECPTARIKELRRKL